MQNRVLMPKELTAANGAKSLFMGEFYTTQECSCPECNGMGHDNTDDLTECDICEGQGSFINKIPVGWDMIKDIYALAVKHFAE